MTEIEEAVATPKELRTPRQRQLIFGDCNPERKLEDYRSRAEELVRRLDNGEPLTKMDAKEARRYKREGII